MGFLVFNTSWGWIGVAVSGNGTRAGVSRIVLGLASRRSVERAFAEDRSRLAPNAPRLTSEQAALVTKAQAQLNEFVAGTRRQFDLPLDLSAGTPFQRKVWRAIQRIPYGRVRSYQWVAARVGGKQYARAVGLALGANPVPIIVPCHRIVAHDGSLGGFSCGLRVKRRLLALEGTLVQLGTSVGKSNRRKSQSRGEVLS